MPPGGRIFWYLPLPYCGSTQGQGSLGCRDESMHGKQTEGMQEAWRHPAREQSADCSCTRGTGLVQLTAGGVTAWCRR